jgi:hypothetical protein
MKNKLMTVLGAAAVLLAVAQTSQATAITGTIGFSGSAVLNSGTVEGATQVTTWGNTVVTTDSGTFTTGASPAIVLNTSTVTFDLTPWIFNTTVASPGSDFWTVGGFTFDLLSSSVFSDAGGFLNVNVNGTVSGNGYTLTDFVGTFQVADPDNGNSTFTTRLSFNSVPDGGTTMMLLGSALMGLGLIKRKLSL